MRSTCGKSSIGPTLNKYEIAALSIGLLAVLLPQGLEKTHRRKIVHLHFENYSTTFNEHVYSTNRVNDYGSYL